MKKIITAMIWLTACHLLSHAQSHNNSTILSYDFNDSTTLYTKVIWADSGQLMRDGIEIGVTQLPQYNFCRCRRASYGCGSKDYACKMYCHSYCSTLLDTQYD